MKERLGMTDMRKFANRMNFGEIGDDVDQSDLGADLGQLTAKGASGSGKVRVAPVDKKTQVRISKALQQKIARNNSAMRASALGGTMSVLAGGGRNVDFLDFEFLISQFFCFNRNIFGGFFENQTKEQQWGVTMRVVWRPRLRSHRSKVSKSSIRMRQRKKKNLKNIFRTLLALHQ